MCPLCQIILCTQAFVLSSLWFQNIFDGLKLVICQILLHPFAVEHPTEHEAAASTEVSAEAPAEVAADAVAGFKCHHCDSTFATASNARRHERERHAIKAEPIFCVDVQRGIFVTAKNAKGQRVPIHICKSTASQMIGCEAEDCRDFMALANRSGRPGVECDHLGRVPFAPSYRKPEILMPDAILAMVDKGLVSEERERECTNMNDQARAEGACTVYPIFYDDYGYSGRYVFFFCVHWKEGGLEHFWTDARNF